MIIESYKASLAQQVMAIDSEGVEKLALLLMKCIRERRRLFICGNGGSAGNANHLANDFTYGIDPTGERAIDVESLSANSSVLTCLANDIGYDNVYSHQLKVKAKAKDILIVLSGSGNSDNIVNALTTGNDIGMTTFAILGYSGGKAKALADDCLHSAIDDMQVAEDIQIVIGHMLMRILNSELNTSVFSGFDKSVVNE